jgi:hypothetical protein
VQAAAAERALDAEQVDRADGRGDGEAEDEALEKHGRFDVTANPHQSALIDTSMPPQQSEGKGVPQKQRA